MSNPISISFAPHPSIKNSNPFSPKSNSIGPIYKPAPNEKEAFNASVLKLKLVLNGNLIFFTFGVNSIPREKLKVAKSLSGILLKSDTDMSVANFKSK